ncbi:MAG TPA: hypothetical protein VNJ08_07085 [Bacteriovoracaceae bacterium]|nr:hypothetical protein [Bacteriovoracaceae bacterium]
MKLMVALLFCLISTAHASTPELPRLFFSYSWLYDSENCVNAPEEIWMAEIEERTESFSELWHVRGQELFKVLFDHTGLGFSRKEMTATFSVCPKKASFSNPLVLSMTPYLNSYMRPKPAYGDDAFVDLVFHELLHTWVVEHLEKSELRAKYKEETPSVRNHMHLMAIQQFVYLKLGREDLVSMLNRLYAKIGSSYARSWEIVQIEGFEAFMNEFPTHSYSVQTQSL